MNNETRNTHRHRGESGQALPLFVMLLVGMLGVIGLAVDAGRLYVARAELSRALDSAALAGVIELPNMPAAEDRAAAYMEENEPGATLTFPAQTQNQFRVQGTRRVNFVFMQLLGYDRMDIGASAAAGFGTVPSDTALIVDATGSMGSAPACNGSQNNSGCPIWEAKQAALGFTDLFLGSNNLQTKIGYTPFRGCHNPPRTTTGCVVDTQHVDLTSSKPSVTSAINNTNSIGGTGTNVCLGLYKAKEMFDGPNHQSASNTVKSLVIMSDGDNTYNAVSYSATQGSPPTLCRPTANASSSDGDVSSNCAAAQSRERSVDTKTKQLADTLRAQNVEIYIVAFGVCGTLNSTVASASYCANIGNGDHDNTADQRLLKCIASSTNGTNDHYFAVPTASDLPGVFEDVAHAIAFRLIE